MLLFFEHTLWSLSLKEAGITTQLVSEDIPTTSRDLKHSGWISFSPGVTERLFGCLSNYNLGDGQVRPIVPSSCNVVGWLKISSEYSFNLSTTFPVKVNSPCLCCKWCWQSYASPAEADSSPDFLWGWWLSSPLAFPRHEWYNILCW